MLIKYVSNLKAKRSIQKKILTIYQHVVLRNNCGNHFTTSTLTASQGLKNCLFTIKKFYKVISMLIKFVTYFKAKKDTQKDIQNLPTCIGVRNHFNTTSFDTLLRAEFFLLTMKFLA